MTAKPSARVVLTTRQFSQNAIDRSRYNALEWLKNSAGHGYPRSLAQEELDEQRRGYSFYDDDYPEAPTIVGYETLEREGLVTRRGTVNKHGLERVHFELVRSLAAARKERG